MFVSAVDQKGEPVEGLGPDDFVIREDGAAREVLRVSRATEPIDIAILVDDSGASEGVMPRVREGLTAFINTMSKGNQIAIVAMADRPTILSDYSSNTRRLLDAVGLLWPRSRSGSTFMDSLYEVSRGLEKAGAAIHAVTVGNFMSSDTDELRNRGRVLAEGTKDTGGQRVNLLTPMAVQSSLERLGRELSSQYKVVYGRPESLIPPEKIEVSARRPGLTMRGTLERGTGTTK
jgi:hypothetical protein